MESLTSKRIAEKGAATLRFIGSRLIGGGWAELGDIYGEAVGGLEKHRLTIVPAPLNNVIEFPHGLRLRSPVEHGWDTEPPGAA